MYVIPCFLWLAIREGANSGFGIKTMAEETMNEYLHIQC